MKKQKLGISLARASSGQRHYWHVQISDRASGKRFLDLDLTDEQFSHLLASHHFEATAMVEDSPDLWKTQENRNILIPFSQASGWNEQTLKKIAADAEIAAREQPDHRDDAPWIPDAMESWNSSRVSGNEQLRTYFVTIRRYRP